MTLWIAWSVLTSALVAAGAMSLERVAAYLGKPRRFIWIAAMTLSVCAPVAIAFRRGDTGSTSPGQSSLRERLPLSPSQSDSIVSTAVAPPTIHALWLATAERTRAIMTTADPWIVRAWIVASSILLLILLRATVAVRRLRSRLDAVDTEIGDVLVGSNVGPAVVGVVRPRVVIPSWVLSLDAERRSLLLRHEFEHVRAGDTRLLFAVEVALVLFPWNAPLWLMARRLRLAIEIDCDARVISRVGRAREYGDMLLSVADRYSAQLPNAASLSEPQLSLETRIEAMTTPRRGRPVLASLPFVAIALAVLVTAAWTPRPVAPVVIIPAWPIGSAQTEDSTLKTVGYLQRRSQGNGFFVDGGKIDRKALVFSDVLRTAPGLRITATGNGRTNDIRDARKADGCVNVYVDGTFWQPVTPGDVDEQVRPEELIAVEVYRDDATPRQYQPRGQGQCATIIAWTTRWVARRR